MNIYTYTFAAHCPNNGESIIYTLEIRSQTIIHVEHIKTACALHDTAYHEDIADDLAARFGGDQTLTANHHGVNIRTERAAPPAGNTGEGEAR